MYKGKDNLAAVFEWCIAFIFTLYVLTFFGDLLPAVHTRHNKSANQITETEMDENNRNGHADEGVNGQSQYYSNGLPVNGSYKPAAPVTANGNTNGYVNGTNGYANPPQVPNAGVNY
jgi:hypothetical protein